MYNLGDQFNFDYNKAKANQENIIQGETYRFTILSERVIRMEYNRDGVFEDRPTERIWYRNMKPVHYEKQESKRILKIKTKYFELTYMKNKDFLGTKMNSTANLKVNLLNTDRFWYYKHPEIRNYGAPIFSLDNQKGEPRLAKGLYSVDGFSSIDDSQSLVFTERGNLETRTPDSRDIYLFMYLKDFALCLKDYFMLTGSPALIPRYALGNWWSKDKIYSEQEIMNLLEQFKINSIPISIFMFNKNWNMNPNHMNGFTWNHKYFPNPQEILSKIHSQNIRVGLSVNPLNGFSAEEQYFNILAKYIQPDPTGNIPFNTLDSKTIDAYLKIIIHPLEQQGIDFFYPEIEDKKEIQQLFILDHYHTMDHNYLQSKRPMVLSRNPKIAPHRYPILYSGKTFVSWNTLKIIPYYNGSAANLGISYIAHDIGGYHLGTEDSELYTRFVQLGTFSPILKFGAAGGKYYRREPWKWGTKTYHITKNYLNLRHRLIPYLYSEAYKYSKYGAPLVLPVYYTEPKMYDDLNYRTEYSFGSELFICPITTKKEHLINRVIHKFYLPEGIWYDLIIGKKFVGGRNHLSFFRDEDYPVFAKAGAIIPFSNDKILNSTEVPKNLEIQIFPGKSNQFRLYEDDGITEAYKIGNYIITAIEYNYLPNNYTLIIRPIEGKSGIIPDRRNYKLVFRNTKQANEVFAYFNDQRIGVKQYAEENDFIIEIENIPTVGQVSINCKGNNIEIDAARIINEDIESIIADLPITTTMKESIDTVFFSNQPIRKKRIDIRKLSNKGLEKSYINLFLKLLDYIDQIYR